MREYAAGGSGARHVVAYHVARHFKVSYDAVRERAQRADADRRAAYHLLRRRAEGYDFLLPLAVEVAHRYDRGLVYRDALRLHVDDRVHRADVYPYFVVEYVRFELKQKKLPAFRSFR